MTFKTTLASVAAALAIFTAGAPLASAQTYYGGYNNGYYQQSYNPAGHIVYQNGVATWSNTSTYTYTSSGTTYYPNQYQTYPYQNYNYQYSYPTNNYQYQYPQNNYNYGYNYNNSYNNGYGNSYCNQNQYNPSGHIRYTSTGVAYWQNEYTPANNCW